MYLSHSRLCGVDMFEIYAATRCNMRRETRNILLVFKSISEPSHDFAKNSGAIDVYSLVFSFTWRSPDSTAGGDGSGAHCVAVNLSQVMPPPMSISNQSPAKTTVSPVPVKRPRFSFQAPATPLKMNSGLKLRNQNQNQSSGGAVRNTLGKILPPGATPTLSSALAAVSRDARVQLQILAQPEEQHRGKFWFLITFYVSTLLPLPMNSLIIYSLFPQLATKRKDREVR